MEEMIKKCLETKSEDEEMVFAFGVGRLIPVIGKMRAMKRTLEHIKKMDGFIGIHPLDMWHNLLLFSTLNDAKRGRNDLKSKGVSVGEVAPVLVERRFINGCD